MKAGVGMRVRSLGMGSMGPAVNQPGHREPTMLSQRLND